MLDQLKIGDKYSVDDFEASICERKIGKPAKKIVREQIPFSNTTYDFSKIDGEIYWEDRELTYVFEIIADTPKELEDKKGKFASWVMNIQEEKLWDPFIEGFYFKATFANIDEEDDESIEKSTITVKFTAYPYMIADKSTTYACSLSASVAQEISITNNSSHRVDLIVESEKPVVIMSGNESYDVQAGTTSGELLIEPGETLLTISSEEDCNIILEFTEEVF